MLASVAGAADSALELASRPHPVLSARGSTRESVFAAR
jgi:hypothetical protein